MMKKVMAFRDAYQMFMDTWKLYRKYADSRLDEEDCRMAVEDAERLRATHKSIFASEVLTAVMCELSRITKNKS